VIVLFATIGQLSHHGHLSATGYAEDALPFLVTWFAAYRVFDGRFLPTWLVGITAGVVLRAVILSHYRWNELAFWLVALVFIGAVALALRYTFQTLLRAKELGPRRR
jgi:membrane-associated PAP2 superfamily phosphatase